MIHSTAVTATLRRIEPTVVRRLFIPTPLEQPRPVAALLLQQVKQPPQPITYHVPNFPRQLESVILKSLEKQPARRYQNAAQFAEALDLARALDPATVAYDVMDDLASFRNAPEGLRLRQRRLLNEADVVFTGGRTLYEGVSRHREDGCHLFPSGVDVGHYAQSLGLREKRSNTGSKVAGYVGVIDERLDLELLAGLALPDCPEFELWLADQRERVALAAQAALRAMATSYPYDSHEDEVSLRSHPVEISEHLKAQLDERLTTAGVDVIDARISHLAYAPEIAGAMLQRQQANAVVAARTRIVFGAVSMVEMALEELKKSGLIDLDEERRAAMVSNLLVVLCSDRAVQPVVNTGTLHT